MLERNVPFGRSCIWDLQHRFFVDRGPDAWRRHGVPSYITSNPAMADAYARLIGAWIDGLGPASGVPVILELGSGSGALAFRLVQRLADSGRRFRYVMSDIAESNLDSWAGHPKLAPLVEQGLLDCAYFDVTRPARLRLRSSGEEITPAWSMPGMAVIGQYLLDSIPTDLFRVRSGILYEALATLVCDADPQSLPPESLLNHLSLEFTDRPVDPRPYGHRQLDEILEEYRTGLDDSYVLLPAAGIQALEWLKDRAGGNLLVLAADKGRWLTQPIDGSPPPPLAHHGSFSIEVNFHALARHCEAAGGTAYLPSRRPLGITVACYCYGRCPQELGSAYRVMEANSPDEQFRSINAQVHGFGEMDEDELLGIVRNSRYDPLPFQIMLPRWRALAGSMDESSRADLIRTIGRVWDQYFPSGTSGEADLGYELGVLAFLLGDLPVAAEYFTRSIDLFGPVPGTLLNLATCFERLGEPARASELAQQAVDLEPMNPLARTLLLRCMGGEQIPG